MGPAVLNTNTHAYTDTLPYIGMQIAHKYAGLEGIDIFRITVINISGCQPI